MSSRYGPASDAVGVKATGAVIGLANEGTWADSRTTGRQTPPAEKDVSHTPPGLPDGVWA